MLESIGDQILKSHFQLYWSYKNIPSFHKLWARNYVKFKIRRAFCSKSQKVHMVQSYDLYILNLHFIQNLCYKKYFEFCRWFRCKVPLYILNLHFWCAPSEKRRTLITTYISNWMSVYQKILTFLNHHSPTSTSPAGLIFLLYSLFFLV